jgi:GNAT superfamily N-acetyltransferase
VQVVRTYLELPRTASGDDARDDARDDGIDVARIARPTATDYRALYAAVGADWHWRDRDAWSDERLQRHLDDPAVSLWVLRDAGAPVGYFELVRRANDEDGRAEVELLYFGLVAAAQGRGIGRRLLERAIAEAWALGAERLVLNTCTLDHPGALPNYLARGFRVVREERYEVDTG